MSVHSEATHKKVIKAQSAEKKKIVITIICSGQCMYVNSDGVIRIAFTFQSVVLEAMKEKSVPEPVPRGVRFEKLLTARL